MPLPRWVAGLNKRTFNRLELRRGRRPVLSHVGRTSGRAHQTPLDAHPVTGGYLFILMYGSGSDWVRNVMAAGKARLTVGGDEVAPTSPRLVGIDEARRLLPAGAKLPAEFLNVTEFLQMDEVV